MVRANGGQVPEHIRILAKKALDEENAQKFNAVTGKGEDEDEDNEDHSIEGIATRALEQVDK